MSTLLRRIYYLLNRRRLDNELANDMEFHREMAEREGAGSLGNALQFREQAREAWGWTWTDRLSQDLRYSARVLRKSPGFTLAAILMLAAGIGVNVAVFSFFDLLVLRPLNVKDPATLLRFHRRGEQNFAYALPYPEMAFFREHTRTLSAVIALNETRLAAEGEPKPLVAHFVSPDFFRELGAAPALGRMLDASDVEPAVVLDHRYWVRHFGADPLIVGHSIRLNGKPATIIGVASADFAGLSLNEPDLWASIGQQPYFAAGSRLLTDYSVESPGVEMWGRLQPGSSPAAAEQELHSLAAQLHQEQPESIWEKETLPSEPGAFAQSLIIGNRHGSGAEGRGEIYPIFAMIAALGLLILAVACGNLGSLLLARGISREREIAIRIAVGAGRGRLVRQLFTESLVLALLGSVAGLGLGYLVLRSLLVLTNSPSWLSPSPDWRIVAFALAAGFSAAVLSGLTPALQTARQRHRATTLRQVLIGAQVAASCVLLIVAGLLVRALNHATSTSPGFEYEHVVSIKPGLDTYGYSPARARAYLDTLESRLKALPGVQSMSLALTPPLGNGSITVGYNKDNRAFDIQLHRVDTHFFETMQIPLLRGHSAAPGDTHAIVVGESLARGLWPGEDPLGKKFSLGEDYVVVGVARNARLIRMNDSNSVEAYLPIQGAELPSLALVVRTSSTPESLARSAAAAARGIDPAVFPQIQLLKENFREKLKGAEYSTISVGLLGFVALLLACTGIVGLVAYAVSQRTKEIGIRMALGARPASVLYSVLRQFSRSVTIGLAIGVVTASVLSRLISGELYGVSNLDPATYLAAIAIFTVTAVLAALLPARKALRIDPMRALRQD